MDSKWRTDPDGKIRVKRVEEITTPSVLDGRKDAGGKRRLKLNNTERREIRRQRLVERAVSFFLDTETSHSWAEIAKDLGISVQSLRSLTKTEAFVDAYNENFAELGHDPRLQAAQAQIADMLPMAVRELRGMAMSPDTPAGTRYKAIEKILSLNGISAVQQKQSDLTELGQFLTQMNIENVNVGVPNPYGKDITSYVEGKVTELPAHVTQGNRVPEGYEDPMPDEDQELG